MIDFKDRKDLLFVFIIGTLIIIGLFIFSLIIIWNPTKNDEYIVGKISTDNININDEYKAYQYVKRLSTMFKNDEYEKIYSLIAKDYIVYNNFTLDKLKEKIADSGLKSQNINLQSVNSTSYKGYSTVLLLSVVGDESGKSARLVIREKSPRQFELAFDDLIFYEVSSYEKTLDNIKLNILSIRYESNYVYYLLNITNKAQNTIVLKYDSNDSYFILNYNSGSLTGEDKIFGNSVEIAPGQTKDYSLAFNINTINPNYITGLTLKNVKMTESRVVDLFYEF